jgi:ferritin-like protein
MKNSTSLGMNRTGIKMSPFDSAQLKKYAELQPADPMTSQTTLREERQTYTKTAAPLGSVPLPGTLKGGALMMAEKIVGQNVEVLIDKLGERLAFERAGVRLYEAFLAKLEVLEETIQDELIERVRHFHKEEAEHFSLVAAALEEIGADPSAQTPCADVASVASAGALKVIQDPRTNIAQSLNALLIVELTDTAGWELLISLAQLNNQKQMVESFNKALIAEQTHLETIKNWLQREVFAQQA